MSPRLEAAGLATLLAGAAVLFTRGLDSAPNYDEGVYLASDDALRAGGELGSDVFASQPPGFYVLLRLATALPGDSVAADRWLFVALALAGLAAAWSLVRTLVSPAAGLAAAAILGVAPAFAANAARVSADVPAMVLALAGLALLALARQRRSRRIAVGAGALLAFAVAVKLLAVVALAAAVALLVGHRRLAVATVGGALAAGLLLLLPVADSLSALWDDVVGFHSDARGSEGSISSNAETVLRAFHPRLAWPWLVLGGAALAVWRRTLLQKMWPLWLWTLLSIAFLTWHRPLLDHHFALLAAAASVAAGATLGDALDGLRRGRLVAATAVGLVLAAAYAQEWRALERLPDPEPDVERAALLVAARTAPGETIVADLPIVAHLADRRLPGELVDTSAVRFDAGSLAPGCILELADSTGARVVVVGRMFKTIPSLLEALADRFPEERRVGEISLLERGRAAARAAQGAAPGSCSGRPASRSPSSSAAAPRG